MTQTSFRNRRGTQTGQTGRDGAKDRPPLGRLEAAKLYFPKPRTTDLEYRAEMEREQFILFLTEKF